MKQVARRRNARVGTAAIDAARRRHQWFRVNTRPDAADAPPVVPFPPAPEPSALPTAA